MPWYTHPCLLIFVLGIAAVAAAGLFVRVYAYRK